MLIPNAWDGVIDVDTFLLTARLGGSLPLPGLGETGRRFTELRKLSARCPSLGRLVEAHCDAQVIFAEAKVPTPLYFALAVWASSSHSSVSAKSTSTGLLLNGTQKFCGGAGVVDGALLAVATDEGEQLVFLRLNQRGVSIDLSTWTASAFRDAGVGTVELNNVEIRFEDCIGPPNFYSTRPGFWIGAIAVAACWAGIADHVVFRRRSRSPVDDISLISLGRRTSLVLGNDSVLHYAAQIIDERPGEDHAMLALCVRHLVASTSQQILSDLEFEAGPAPLAFDPSWLQAVTELRMALGQCHGDRDLRELGILTTSLFRRHL